MASLSAILIAKNEERDLPGCLESLKGLADEIILIVSDDTTDRTEEIAKAAGATVTRRKFDNYALQRQASLDAATNEWCLWIDPDERVTPELKAAILKEIADKKGSAYDIRFEIHFLGKTMYWGGLGGESHVRLFARNSAKFTGGDLHESLVIAHGQRTMPLSGGKMIHEPYRDIADYLSKLDRYTNLAAKKRFEAGKQFTIFHHLILPWEFFARAFLKLGILDGYPGLVWAGLSSFHSWLKYVKLGRMYREISK